MILQEEFGSYITSKGFVLVLGIFNSLMVYYGINMPWEDFFMLVLLYPFWMRCLL